MRASRPILGFGLLLLALLLVGGCADDASAPSDGDAETEADSNGEADPDLASESEEEAAAEIEETTESEETAETEGDGEGGLAVPYVPPAFSTPYVDEVYLQEFNHTTNEVEPGLAPLTAVIRPPASYAGFPTPLLVTPRGVVRPSEGKASSLVTIPADHPDLIAGSACSCAPILISPSRLYVVNDDWTLTEKPVPEGLTLLGLAPGQHQVLILTDQGLGRIVGGTTTEWPSGGGPVTAALEGSDRIYVAGENEIRLFDLNSFAVGAEPIRTITEADGLAVGAIRGMVEDLTLPVPMDLAVVGDNGVAGLDLDPTPTVLTPDLFAAGRVPFGSPRGAAKTSDGGFLVFTSGGACRVMERGIGPEWRVYNQERWLPSEDVRGALTMPETADSPIWFATAGGLATVTASRMTLEEKMIPFVERVVQRHDRDGAVADSHLTRRGDLSSNIPWDSDNDGGWTSYWLMTECFRWVVTGDAEAKAHFDKSLDAMLRLRDATGTDYFLARAVIRKEGCVLDDCGDPDDGSWYTSPDGEWWVKRDTSNDEVIAHGFMMGHAYDLCADETQRTRIREHIRGIVGGIVDHGYKLIDPVTGKETRYGQWDPLYINHWIEGMAGDGGTRSAQMLALLTFAHYLTGEERFMEAKRYLMEEEHYDVNTINESDYVGRQGSGDGDELGVYAWFILLRYENDPVLRERLMEGWEKTYAHLGLQQAAWWDMVHAVVGGNQPDLRNALRWLRLAPMDMIRWYQHNSQRLDLIDAPEYYKSGAGKIRSDGRIIPYDERRCDRWNTDQYRVDGGMGAVIEMDGADVLAPYWMGRAYGFITPAP